MTEFRTWAAIMLACLVLGMAPVVFAPPNPSESSPRLPVLIVLVCALAFGVFLFVTTYFQVFPFSR